MFKLHHSLLYFLYLPIIITTKLPLLLWQTPKASFPMRQRISPRKQEPPHMCLYKHIFKLELAERWIFIAWYQSAWVREQQKALILLLLIYKKSCISLKWQIKTATSCGSEAALFNNVIFTFFIWFCLSSQTLANTQRQKLSICKQTKYYIQTKTSFRSLFTHNHKHTHTWSNTFLRCRDNPGSGA